MAVNSALHRREGARGGEQQPMVKMSRLTAMERRPQRTPLNSPACQPAAQPLAAACARLRMKQRNEKASTMMEPALLKPTMSRACVNLPSASHMSASPEAASPCRFCVETSTKKASRPTPRAVPNSASHSEGEKALSSDQLSTLVLGLPCGKRCVRRGCRGVQLTIAKRARVFSVVVAEGAAPCC